MMSNRLRWLCNRQRDRVSVEVVPLLALLHIINIDQCRQMGLAKVFCPGIIIENLSTGYQRPHLTIHCRAKSLIHKTATKTQPASML